MVINPPWQLAVTVGRKSWSMDAWHSIWNNKIQISCWHHYANQGLGPIWINFKEKKNNWMTWLLSFWIIFLTRADRWPQRWQVPLRRTNEVFTFFWINKCVIYWNVIVHTNFPFFSRLPKKGKGRNNAHWTNKVVWTHQKRNQTNICMEIFKSSKGGLFKI